MKDTKANVRRSNEALKDRLLRLMPEPGFYPAAIDGLKLVRVDADMRTECFNDPRIVVMVQGDKRAIVADQEYHFGEGRYIAYGIDLPAISYITGASVETPLLTLSIPLDRYILTQLITDLSPTLVSSAKAYKGVTVAEVTAELLDACFRLVNLIDTPERIPVFAPMIMREIHYYLLTGQGGEDFRLLGTVESPNNQIARAVSWLRSHYQDAFNLTELAGQVNMSQSSFCRHFSRITGMSPLQFQKRLRLYEAQRLMLTEDASAETAAFTVGYESPTQFNREYKRQFGEPPRRDIAKLVKAKTVVL
jgi:AraC-like DNA-binding protein